MPGGFLIVEDEPTLARTLARTFGRHGPVEVVYSMAAARVQLRAHEERTGVVLDLILPDGSGLDLLAEIRQTHGGLPVLVDGQIVGGVGCSSGTPDQDEVVSQAGIDAFLDTRGRDQTG